MSSEISGKNRSTLWWNMSTRSFLLSNWSRYLQMFKFSSYQGIAWHMKLGSLVMIWSDCLKKWHVAQLKRKIWHIWHESAQSVNNIKDFDLTIIPTKDESPWHGTDRMNLKILYLYFHLCEYWTAFAFVFAFALVKPVYPQGEALHCELHSNCLCSKFEKVLRSKLFQLKHDIKTLQVLHSPDKWRMAKMWFWLTAKNIKSRPWLHPGTLRENSSLPESRQKALNWN